MNNYFGIGLDAKISLDFNKCREDHPEKRRSRARNRMFYGMLGGREVVAKTFKNLEQRVRLECDGQLISLPNLQGIVILNIPRCSSRYSHSFCTVLTFSLYLSYTLSAHFHLILLLFLLSVLGIFVFV